MVILKYWQMLNVSHLYKSKQRCCIIHFKCLVDFHTAVTSDIINSMINNSSKNCKLSSHKFRIRVSLLLMSGHQLNTQKTKQMKWDLKGDSIFLLFQPGCMNICDHLKFVFYVLIKSLICMLSLLHHSNTNTRYFIGCFAQIDSYYLTALNIRVTMKAVKFPKPIFPSLGMF